MLDLNEMIKMLHVVACSIVFPLLFDRDSQRGVLKRMKNEHFLVLSAVCVLILKFSGKVKGDLI